MVLITCISKIGGSFSIFSIIIIIIIVFLVLCLKVDTSICKNYLVKFIASLTLLASLPKFIESNNKCSVSIIDKIG